jgi:hypothetical protein
MRRYSEAVKADVRRRMSPLMRESEVGGGFVSWWSPRPSLAG